MPSKGIETPDKHNEPQNNTEPKVSADDSSSKPPISHNTEAEDVLDWSKTAFELKLDAIARQFVLNSVVKSFKDDVLELAFLPELEVMLKPDIEKQIKRAIEAQLGVSLKLEFLCVPSLDVETPHQAELRRLEQERQHVIQQIRQDPMVQQLKSVFGAELIEQSVQKHNTKH